MNTPISAKGKKNWGKLRYLCHVLISLEIQGYSLKVDFGEAVEVSSENKPFLASCQKENGGGVLKSCGSTRWTLLCFNCWGKQPVWSPGQSVGRYRAQRPALRPVIHHEPV